VIREAGPQAQDRSIGQRVVAAMPFGSHAERVAVAANATWLVPDGLDIQQASAIPIAFGTADDCLFEFGRLQAGETVLVQAGAGGVGLAAIQLAKRAGATVLATASSDDRLARLQDYGLDHGINYRTGNFVEETRKLTNGRGANLVVDSVGGRTLQGSVEAACYRGRIITVGQAGRDGEVPDVRALSAGNKSLTGVFLGAELAVNPARGRANIARLIDDVAKGALRVVIDRTYPLAEAAAAHAYIESRQAFGRVLLVP